MIFLLMSMKFRLEMGMASREHLWAILTYKKVVANWMFPSTFRLKRNYYLFHIIDISRYPVSKYTLTELLILTKTRP